MAVTEAERVTRKESMWICGNCKTQFSVLPAQCGKCGALPAEFVKEEVPLPENMPRKTYRVLENILYDGNQYNGPYSLIECSNQKCNRTYRHPLPPDLELGMPKCKCGSVKFHDKPVPGALITLPVDDRVTKGLIKRSLIEEVPVRTKENKS